MNFYVPQEKEICDQPCDYQFS